MRCRTPEAEGARHRGDRQPRRDGHGRLRPRGAAPPRRGPARRGPDPARLLDRRPRRAHAGVHPPGAGRRPRAGVALPDHASARPGCGRPSSTSSTAVTASTGSTRTCTCCPPPGRKEAIFHLPFSVVDPLGDRRHVLWGDPGYPVYDRGARLAGGVSDPVALTRRGRVAAGPDRPARRAARPRLHRLDQLPAQPDRGDGRPAVAARPGGLRPRARPAAGQRRVLPGGLVRPARPVGAGGRATATSTGRGRRRVAVEALGHDRLPVRGDRRRPRRRRGCSARCAPTSAPRRRTSSRPRRPSAWGDQDHVDERRAVFAAKRDVVLGFLDRAGIEVSGSDATFYVWFRAPGGDDVAYAEALLDAGVVASPGRSFGPAGQGGCGSRWSRPSRGAAGGGRLARRSARRR